MPKSMTRALMALVLGTLIVVAGQGTGVLAAETTGTLSGTITDSAGHPLSNVAVSAVAPSMTSRTLTGANGFYVLTGLAPDTYTLTFSREGYQSQEITGVTIVQGGSQKVSLSLSTEPKVLGRVSVRSAASLIQPKTTSEHVYREPADDSSSDRHSAEHLGDRAAELTAGHHNRQCRLPDHSRVRGK